MVHGAQAPQWAGAPQRRMFIHLERQEICIVTHLKHSTFALALGLCVAGACSLTARADVIGDRVNDAATHLMGTQDGTNHLWPDEISGVFNGPIIAGMARAYSLTNNGYYLTSA